MNKKPEKQNGLTLIEVMIAMLIGLLLLLGVFGMFMANKRIYTEQESMARLQENARFAVGMLVKDVHMAGYVGCSHDAGAIVNHLNDGDNAEQIFSFVQAVEGSENAGAWQPSGSTDIIASILPGTDALTLRYLNPLDIRISSAMPASSAQLMLDDTGEIQVEDIVAVSDCDSTDVIQITQVQSSPAQLQHAPGTAISPGNNTPHTLQKSYGTDARIMRFVSHRYFIRNNPDGVPSLFRKSIEGSSLELVEGVENMQILYGEDLTGDNTADSYLIATDVTNWDNVVSIRLGLLLRTINENRQLEPDTRVYQVLGGVAAGGATVGPMNDFHRRKLYTTTVLIRNRRN